MDVGLLGLEPLKQLLRVDLALGVQVVLGRLELVPELGDLVSQLGLDNLEGRRLLLLLVDEID